MPLYKNKAMFLCLSVDQTLISTKKFAKKLKIVWFNVKKSFYQESKHQILDLSPLRWHQTFRCSIWNTISSPKKVFDKWIQKSHLKSFRNKINTKHYCIKFNFKFSQEKIQLLEILVYKDNKNPLNANWLPKSVHPLSTKRVSLTVKHSE